MRVWLFLIVSLVAIPLGAVGAQEQSLTLKEEFEKHHQELGHKAALIERHWDHFQEQLRRPIHAQAVLELYQKYENSPKRRDQAIRRYQIRVMKSLAQEELPEDGDDENSRQQTITFIEVLKEAGLSDQDVMKLFERYQKAMAELEKAETEHDQSPHPEKKTE